MFGEAGNKICQISPNEDDLCTGWDMCLDIKRDKKQTMLSTYLG